MTGSTETTSVLMSPNHLNPLEWNPSPMTTDGFKVFLFQYRRVITFMQTYFATNSNKPKVRLDLKKDGFLSFSDSGNSQ